MKNLLAVLVSSLFFINSHIALAQKSLCIELINSNANVVEFSGKSDPGWIYKVPPREKAILSGDHMRGACEEDNCTVWVKILDGLHPSRDYIYNLPRGASIIYYGVHDYRVNLSANVPCV
ncbi:MAG: hypothetical protein K0S27_907 [Gammaproteobacteria bacterium]|jgi:hypothetical protein|nr:hypothetical protein [Gammaproteobacteria bacterium]